MHSKSKIKIGFITKENPEDIKAYSGTHFFMMKALSKYAGEVLPIGPVKPAQTPFRRIQAKIIRVLSGKVYRHQYNAGLAKASAKLIQKKVEKLSPDILVGSLVSPEAAFLETDIPLLLTTDATFPLLKDNYQSHSNLHPKTVSEARMLERKAFQNAYKLILPLQWIANSAVNEYNIERDKIEIAQYGPNLVQSITEQEFEHMLDERSTSNELQLLFVGVRWEEKGGPVAVKAVEELNRMGIKSKLTVCGIEDRNVAGNKYVQVVGNIDKSEPGELKKFNTLFKKAHVFILPTRAECICMSCLEAAAFGLPVVASDTGGVPESVKNGETGVLLPVHASGRDYAERIKLLWQDKESYENMSRAGYRLYKQQHNWDAWGKKVSQIVKEILTTV